ncbi:MAG: D-tyrosyl-tRNA(Tyr) deacylase [Dehalococcoidia bacterium]|nr:D-tyrosyl-tRNA(Tyr) deacylase [Dehalococcoidia bacterium]
MRAVVQRVTRAKVRVEGEVTGAIGRGLVVLLGVTHEDTPATAERFAEKLAGLRVFEDADGKMNVGIREAGGDYLCISQFTLYGDVRKGRRPSFTEAAPPAIAEPLYELVCVRLAALAGVRCERGVFGAEMAVELVNDGPVTLILDSRDLEAPRRP